MNKKEDHLPLTMEQEQEVFDILARIREGLDIPVESQFEEPAHVFNPGVFYVKK